MASSREGHANVVSRVCKRGLSTVSKGMKEVGVGGAWRDGVFFFSSRRRHTRFDCDWSSDVCSSDLDWHPADRVLVVSRMPVVVRGRTIGYVATFRDRTELEGLLRELDNARSVSEEIGRASCRERGVDLGGRRIIKKKKQETRLAAGQ